MQFTVFTASCTGKRSNCNYPKEVVVSDETGLKEAVAYDHVCAKYQGNYRSVDNFLSSDCLVMDLDNDHSEDPAEWITSDKLIELIPDVDFMMAASRHHMLPKEGKSPRPRYLRKTGTIIPVYIREGEYGFMIDGRIYSGDELAHMASNAEGWQIQFQVKDPSEDVLRADEYLMPVRLGVKELVDDTLELLRLFTRDAEFISDHDEDNFTYLFEGVLKKLKLYNDSNPRGFGKLAGMEIIRVLEWYEGTEWSRDRVREIIR